MRTVIKICKDSFNPYKSKKEGKDQESIQSSTTPDLGYQWESDNITIRHHKREPRGQPSVLFVGRKQTVEIQIRRRRTWRLIWVSTVCLQKVISNLNINAKYHLTTLNMEMDWFN